MRARAWYPAVRSGILTLGAVLGVVCLVWTVGLGVLGLRPLVFMSGSMSPAIEAGDVGFARTVEGIDVGVGDIVSVTTESGVRVTHRVVSTSTDEGVTRLRLQGDANNTPDAETYVVERVDLLVGQVPGLGHLLAYAASPWGLAAGGILLVSCLYLGFAVRGDQDDADDANADPSVPSVDVARTV